MRSRKGTTVGELRKLIEFVSDDAVLVTEGGDHSYNVSTAEVTEAWESEQHKTLYEYYGPEYAGEGKGRVIPVLKVC